MMGTLSSHLRWVAARTYSACNIPFFTKCGPRPLFHRALAVPAETVKISVSTVEIYGRRYVSGLRFEVANGDSSVFRYQHANEVALSTGVAGIAGFHVAEDRRGIRGLGVVSTSADVSEWAGDYRDLPTRRLLLGPIAATYSSVQYVKVGSDVSCLPS